MADQGSEFLAGCMACAGAKPRSSNPHEQLSDLWVAWQRGWMDEYRRLPAPLRAVRDRKEPQLLAADDAPPP